MNSPKLEAERDPGLSSLAEKGSSQSRPWFCAETRLPDADRQKLRAARRSHTRSFAKGCMITCAAMAFAYLLLSRSGVRGHSPHGGWPHQFTFSSTDVDTGYPAPADGQVQQCIDSANWTEYYQQPPWSAEYPYGAETSFSLPLDADAQYLISKGVYQLGFVEIDQSTEVTDTVDVRVRVSYYSDDALDRATVCKMMRAENEYGVGIFTPTRARRYRPSDQLKFEIALTLPAGHQGPLSVKQLDTTLPNYSQKLGDLSNSVSFGKISLRSMNGYVTVKSVTADVGEFSSMNGAIDGQFNARSSLVLDNKNGRISSTVNMRQHEGDPSSTLKMRTLNGEVAADVALVTESGTGGNFEVNAESTHGRLALKFTESPLDSVLKCQAQTVVGSLEVQLHSAFEGTYSMQSTLGAKMVEERRVEDPAGKGRRRLVLVNRSGGRVEGEVRWLENDGSSAENESSVSLTSTLGAAKLVL